MKYTKTLRHRIAATCLMLMLCLFSGQTIAAHWHLLHHNENLWDTIGKQERIVKSVAPYRLRNHIRYLLKNKTYLYHISLRARPYLYYIYQQTQKDHMPSDMALLPMIESHFQPFSYSKTGATGLWQLMPGTAAGYGLTLNWWFDGRRDTIEATKAALSYLNYLHRYFHDWPLAIAAYNAGEGRILRAIRENARHHKPVDYWSLSLPPETKIYVPKFLAFASIVAHHREWHVDLAPIPAKPAWQSFSLPGPMHLSQIATLAGIDLTTFRIYNPGYRRDITGPYYTNVLIPVSAASKMTYNLYTLNAQEESIAKWQRYTVKKGDSLNKIAHNYHTSLALIKYVNHLKEDIVHLGQLLFIPKHRIHLAVPFNEKKAEFLISPHVISEAHLPGPTHLIHTVRKGETIAGIAKKYHIKQSQVIYWNGLGWGQKLIPGQKLSLWPWERNRHRQHHGYRLITHRVKAGENLSLIAKRYGTSIKEIKKLNRMKSNTIRIGEKLRVYSRH